jgi:hypothetical protein
MAWCLLAIFLVLKLTGLIAWSWWWVTFPVTFTFFVIGVLDYIEHKAKKWSKK